jgi:hypothetical protein
VLDAQRKKGVKLQRAIDCKKSRRDSSAGTAALGFEFRGAAGDAVD